MKQIDECYKFQADFPKATKGNSAIIGGRLLMIIKKTHDDSKFYVARRKVNGKIKTKTHSLYIAYDYKTKTQLMFHEDKDQLVEYLKTREDDLKEIAW